MYVPVKIYEMSKRRVNPVENQDYMFRDIVMYVVQSVLVFTQRNQIPQSLYSVVSMMIADEFEKAILAQNATERAMDAQTRSSARIDGVQVTFGLPNSLLDLLRGKFEDRISRMDVLRKKRLLWRQPELPDGFFSDNTEYINLFPVDEPPFEYPEEPPEQEYLYPEYPEPDEETSEEGAVSE